MKEQHKYIAIEGQTASKEEAIRLCANALYIEGYVDAGFVEDCLQREHEYPTGLCTEIPVAIPHCKSESIKKNGICYLRLSSPVIFKRLDDDDEEISTRHIFNIAIQDGAEHLDMLRSMMKSFSNIEFMQCLEKTDITKIPELLETHFG